jgi:hypothetical protein
VTDEWERRAADLEEAKRRHLDWDISRATSGRLVARREGALVQEDDAADLDEEIIRWEWRHSAD